MRKVQTENEAQLISSNCQFLSHDIGNAVFDCGAIALCSY